MCEPYDGWTNRESWALALHLGNDMGMYYKTREVVAGGSIYQAADALKEWIEELWEDLPYSNDGRNMMTDVGSLWRVDWAEVAHSFRDESA
jgi:hypothetical protein